MRTKIFITALILAAIWIISCSKEDNNKTSNIPLLSSITTGDTSMQYTVGLHYDQNRRLIEYKIDDTTLMTLTYGNNTVETKFYIMPNVVLTREVYTLNAEGLAVSSVSYSEWKKGTKSAFILHKGFTADTSTYIYEYNGDGYMIRMTEFTSTDTTVTDYTIIAGNVTTEEFSGPYWSTVYNYQYYPDKTNTIGEHNTGIYFLGKQNLNLMKSVSSEYFGETYTYEFDAKGRASRQTGSSGIYQAFTYTD